MQVLSIGADQHIDWVKDRLDRDLRGLADVGILVCTSEFTRGSLNFVRCAWESRHPDELPRASEVFRRAVAESLTHVIIEDWEKAHTRRLVKDSYGHFGQEELEALCAFVSKAVAAGTFEGTAPLADRGTRILTRLMEFLERNDEVVLDGFVRFRLRDYLEELEDAVDRAVDEYLMEREYREFIRLLRYFIEMQESRIEEVHVLVSPSGIYRLVDRENQPLRSDHLDEGIIQMMEGDLGYEDLLVSSLIALAPRLVTIHTKDGAQKLPSLDTLNSIFAERLLVCKGCQLCACGRAEERGVVVQRPKV
jgi:putative sporulation protein YtxC